MLEGVGAGDVKEVVFLREEMSEHVYLPMQMTQQGGTVILREGARMLAEDGPHAGRWV